MTARRVGDGVWIAPGVSGCTAPPNHGHDHIAITEALDDKTADWLQLVRDAEPIGVNPGDQGR